MADPASMRAILRIHQPWANHNGGELAFGPDGYLYSGSGDGGWEGDPLKAGQDISTLLGKVLRIDVDSMEGRQAYAVPEDNPLVQELQVIQPIVRHLLCRRLGLGQYLGVSSGCGRLRRGDWRS